MATITKRFNTGVPPEQAWAVVGDTANVHRWASLFRHAEQEGDIRVCTLADGSGRTRERILRRSDAERRYEYELLESPFGLDRYAGSFAVEAAEDGSAVVWRTTFEPDVMTPQIEGMMTMIAEDLRRHLEARVPAARA